MELLNKRNNTRTIIGLKDICLSINNQKHLCDLDITQFKDQRKDAKSKDEIDELSYDIEQKEATSKELDKKLEEILQYLKTKKSLPKFYEQVEKYLHKITK